MIVVRDFDRLKGKELVATIGFFDGVHPFLNRRDERDCQST